MHPPNQKQISQKVSVDMNSLLGKGSTGNVYRGLCLDPHPHPIAVKVIPLEEIDNQVTKYLLQCQLQALKSTSRCPNNSIVKLQEIVVIDQHVYIAMELLEGGTLKDYITQSKKLQPKKALFILHRILEGYRILKNNQIIHRDLKPDNIIFATDPQRGTLTPKIIDFGYSIVEAVHNKPKMYYNVGSPRYMSPQAYTNNRYSQKSDIWALGIVLYQMLTGTNFDKGKNIVQTFKLIKEKGIPIPSSLNFHCRSILQHMLMLDPEKRFDCEQILSQITVLQNQNQNQTEFPNNLVNNQSNIYKISQNIQNRNVKQFKNVRINDKNVISEATPPSNTRASFIANQLNSPFRGSFFLTKSVGFVMSPQERKHPTNSPFQLNSRMKRGNFLNRSTNQQYRQGPSTDRNNKQNFAQQMRLLQSQQLNTQFINKVRLSNKVNKTMPYSSSEQNLHKKIVQNNPLINFVNKGNTRQNISRQRQVIFNEPHNNNGIQKPSINFRSDEINNYNSPTSIKHNQNINTVFPRAKQYPQSSVHFYSKNESVSTQQQHPIHVSSPTKIMNSQQQNNFMQSVNPHNNYQQNSSSIPSHQYQQKLAIPPIQHQIIQHIQIQQSHPSQPQIQQSNSPQPPFILQAQQMHQPPQQQFITHQIQIPPTPQHHNIEQQILIHQQQAQPIQISQFPKPPPQPLPHQPQQVPFHSDIYTYDKFKNLNFKIVSVNSNVPNSFNNQYIVTRNALPNQGFSSSPIEKTLELL